MDSIDKSELVRTAINRLYDQLKQPQSLREAAQLYAEIYQTDEETRALTESAIMGWRNEQFKAWYGH